MKRFNFASAMVAGFIATIVMTVVMIFMGMDLLKILGSAMGHKGMMVYVMGGLIHLAIGLIFAFVYALIFDPIFQKLPGFLSGTIYGFLIFIFAMIAMPHFMKILQSWGSPQEGSLSARAEMTAYAQPPQNPQYPGVSPDEPYPNEYPRQEPDRYGNQYPDAPQKTVPANGQPAEKKEGMAPWLISLINHLVYGFILGIFYRPRKYTENQE